MITSSTLLRRALLADAIFSGVAGLVLTVDAGPLATLMQLPDALLRETGLFLIAYTILVGWLASRATAPRPLVLLVIAGNAAWTVGSIGLLFSGLVAPNALGEIFVAAQAVGTGVFAELQYMVCAAVRVQSWHEANADGRRPWRSDGRRSYPVDGCTWAAKLSPAGSKT